MTAMQLKSFLAKHVANKGVAWTAAKPTDATTANAQRDRKYVNVHNPIPPHKGPSGPFLFLSNYTRGRKFEF
jgi:hypothetical protein